MSETQKTLSEKELEVRGILRREQSETIENSLGIANEIFGISNIDKIKSLVHATSAEEFNIDLVVELSKKAIVLEGLDADNFANFGKNFTEALGIDYESLIDHLLDKSNNLVPLQPHGFENPGNWRLVRMQAVIAHYPALLQIDNQDLEWVRKLSKPQKFEDPKNSGVYVVIYPTGISELTMVNKWDVEAIKASLSNSRLVLYCRGLLSGDVELDEDQLGLPVLTQVGFNKLISLGDNIRYKMMNISRDQIPLPFIEVLLGNFVFNNFLFGNTTPADMVNINQVSKGIGPNQLGINFAAYAAPITRYVMSNAEKLVLSHCNYLHLETLEARSAVPLAQIDKGKQASHFLKDLILRLSKNNAPDLVKQWQVDAINLMLDFDIKFSSELSIPFINDKRDIRKKELSRRTSFRNMFESNTKASKRISDSTINAIKNFFNRLIQKPIEP